MKITNGKKQEYNNKNTYKIIYNQIKEEIKNVVINKYINQIDSLFKQIEYLKKENALLKNDLIYILKRVLLFKNDNNINNQTSNLYKLSHNGLSNTSLLNNKTYNSFFSSGKTINSDNNYNYRNINNSISKSPTEQRRYSIDDDYRKGNSSFSPIETSRQMNVNNKINFYLNSLYKNNFAEECAAGTNSIHLLNKNQSIYDELFVNRNDRNKNNFIPHINTDINFKKISNSKGKSISKKKNLCIVDDNNNNTTTFRNRKNLINFKTLNNKAKGYLKVKANKKEENLKLKINQGNINKKSEGKSTIYININNNYKNPKINGSNLGSRSRFLVNKF